jgi:hypothetical protein
VALMRRGARVVLLAVTAAAVVSSLAAGGTGAEPKTGSVEFRTSDRCVACHNGLLTASGADVSIGFDWRASMMANSSRDPYWQGSVRRETIDHPESRAAIEDECAVCHMPIPRYMARLRGRRGEVLSHLPFSADDKEGRAASDGVSCSVCHQIARERLGTPESFNGGFVVQPADNTDERPEYGPFDIEAGHTGIMRSSSEGYRPTKSDHIRQSELCATCHTLFTQALGPGGNVIGRLPEQVPYQEWLHSDFRNVQSCQSCHMPAVPEPAPITRVFGEMREGVARHQFVAANFFMQRMLNRYRDALDVAALPHELTNAADETVRFLSSQAARIAVDGVRVDGGRLQADVSVENAGGHKLPTAYPSRRVWIHLVVRDSGGRVVFESGRLTPDGSVQGNDNDADRTKFEPHYSEIRDADQVQIYESILGDANGAVTTGLLAAVKYLKDNRLLPRGFDKRSAEPDIAVVGGALGDADFVGAGDRVRYSIAIGDAPGPFAIEAELMYQPIGFRWANNLKTYDAPEPRRFARYFDSMAASSATTLARARGVGPQ